MKVTARNGTKIFILLQVIQRHGTCEIRHGHGIKTLHYELRARSVEAWWDMDCAPLIIQAVSLLAGSGMMNEKNGQRLEKHLVDKSQEERTWHVQISANQRVGGRLKMIGSVAGQSTFSVVQSRPDEAS